MRKNAQHPTCKDTGYACHLTKAILPRTDTLTHCISTTFNTEEKVPITLQGLILLLSPFSSPPPTAVGRQIAPNGLIYCWMVEQTLSQNFFAVSHTSDSAITSFIFSTVEQKKHFVVRLRQSDFMLHIAQSIQNKKYQQNIFV